jgi:hypothetical protein
MEFEYGDIIDRRKDKIDEVTPHFWVVVAVDEANKKIYSYPILSRVYKAFGGLCNFFNSSCVGQCKHYEHNFKDKNPLRSYNLKDVFFLPETNYKGVLTDDSMVVLNRDPYEDDEDVLQNRKNEGLLVFRTKLEENDGLRLYIYLMTSKNTNDFARALIRQSYDNLKKKRKT